MKIKYSKGEKENIIETVRAAENTDDLPLHAWARAAKVLDAIAASRLELLRRIAGVLPWCPYCEMLVDGNILRHTINCELAEALGDGVEHKTGYGPNDWS